MAHEHYIKLKGKPKRLIKTIDGHAFIQPSFSKTTAAALARLWAAARPRKVPPPRRRDALTRALGSFRQWVQDTTATVRHVLRDALVALKLLIAHAWTGIGHVRRQLRRQLRNLSHIDIHATQNSSAKHSLPFFPHYDPECHVVSNQQQSQVMMQFVIISRQVDEFSFVLHSHDGRLL